MGDSSVSSVNPLEQFVLLAKNAKGAAAVELIKQALEAPTVFVFGELLDMANIQVTSDRELSKTVKIFLVAGSDQWTPRTLPQPSQSVCIRNLQ